MSDYNKYVMAVNKIFELISKMRTNWQNQDNISYIESIEEYKQIVIDNAKLFEAQHVTEQQNKMEELGND